MVSFHSWQSFSVSFFHVCLGLPAPRLPSICIQYTKRVFTIFLIGFGVATLCLAQSRWFHGDGLFNNTAPEYISENFTLRNNVNTSINLRSSAAACFIPPKPRTEYYKHSLRYSGCLVWNSLPEEVKKAQTIDTFHNRCMKWLVN